MWECMICNWRYDTATGVPTSGIVEGTSFDALAHDWTCPECGASKDDFYEVEAA